MQFPFFKYFPLYFEFRSQMTQVPPNSNANNFNRSSVSESSVNNSSFKFCRYCSNETNECPPISALPVCEQIEQLRTIREPLLQNCQNITKFTRQVSNGIFYYYYYFLFQEFIRVLHKISFGNHIQFAA